MLDNDCLEALKLTGCPCTALFVSEFSWKQSKYIDFILGRKLYFSIIVWEAFSAVFGQFAGLVNETVLYWFHIWKKLYFCIIFEMFSLVFSASLLVSHVRLVIISWWSGCCKSFYWCLIARIFPAQMHLIKCPQQQRHYFKLS